MLARTLLAGIQESAEAARIAEEERQQMLANEPVAYDFSDEATLESYWMNEAILEAFEGILHIDKVFHVADIKGEIQAFTENASSEDVEAMLEGIINGSISRIVETLSVLVSKVKAWFDKLIKYVAAMFATGEKFVDKAKSTINAKYNDKAKYGSYKYTSYKYNFGVADQLVNNIKSRIAEAASMKSTTSTPAEDKDLPEEAQKAEAAADVANAAKESVETETTEETLEVVTEATEATETEETPEETTEEPKEEAPVEDEADKEAAKEAAELLEEAEDVSGLMESMLENLEDGVMEAYMDEIVEEEVEVEPETTEESDEVLEGFDLFDFESVEEMFTLDYILESSNATTQVSEICSKLSKGKAKSIAEFKKYYALGVHCGEEKRTWHTFFEDAKPGTMMTFIKSGKERTKAITKDMNEYVSSVNKLIAKLDSISKKALSDKNDSTYQASSAIASTLTVLTDLYQAVIMEKIRLYKEAIAEYTRILKGFILYKGESTKAATTSDETTAATDATEESVEVAEEATENKESKDASDDAMTADTSNAGSGSAEKEAAADTDKAVADAEKTVDDAAAASDADSKEADKATKESAEVAEEACATKKECKEACGDKKSTEESCGSKKATEEACGNGDCKKKATEEACGDKKACKEEAETPAEDDTPVKESFDEDVLSLFDQAFNYI